MYCAAVDAVVNPTIAPALESLRWHLLDQGYSAVVAFDLCHYALEHGHLAGAPNLDPGDEWLASEAFAGGMEEVPYSSDAWGPPDSDVLDLEADFWKRARDWRPCGGWSYDPRREAERDAREAEEWEALCRGHDELMAILDADRPEPSEADWAEYRAHFDRIDREAPYGYE